jgi:hypothetical protein
MSIDTRGTSLAPKMSSDEKQDVLTEVFLLLSEQEQALLAPLNSGEPDEYALRAKRINDLLEQMGMPPL